MHVVDQNDSKNPSRVDCVVSSGSMCILLYYICPLNELFLIASEDRKDLYNVFTLKYPNKEIIDYPSVKRTRYKVDMLG